MIKSYETSCVEAIGRDVQSMVDKAKEITRRTFLKHVSKGDLYNLEHKLGYNQAFKMANEIYVSYFKSKYKGQECVYFVQSAIEHIFV